MLTKPRSLATKSRVLVLLLLVAALTAQAQTEKPPSARARDLGVPFDGTPGQFNAITDVPGVEVGSTTLIRGEGKLNVAKARSAPVSPSILPRGPKIPTRYTPAGSPQRQRRNDRHHLG